MSRAKQRAQRPRHAGGRPPLFAVKMPVIIKGYLPEDLDARFRAACEASGVERSAALRTALEEWLARNG